MPQTALTEEFEDYCLIFIPTYSAPHILFSLNSNYQKSFAVLHLHHSAKSSKDVK